MRLILIAFITALSVQTLAFAQAPPGAEVYGALPAISDAAISPDGRRLILAIAEGDATAVRAIDIDSGRELLAAATPPRNSLRAIGWADDDHATFIMSESVRPAEFFPRGFIRGNPAFVEYARIGIASISANRQYYIEPRAGPSAVPSFFWRIIAPIEGDPGQARAIGVHFGSAAGGVAVHGVSLESGRAGLVNRGAPDTLDFILDERGQVIARVDADERSNGWRVRRNAGEGQFTDIFSGASEIGAPPDVAGLLPDGRLAISDDLESRDLAALIAVDIETGRQSVIFEDARYPIDDAMLDPWTQRVVGVAWTADLPRQHFFDAALQRHAQTLAGQFSDGYAQILSWSRDRRRLLVFGEHANDAGAYYIFEPTPNTLRRIGQRYPSLVGAAHFGERQSITYRARDGARIPAYLTLPAGVERRSLPLVLLVHGGPTSRDNFAFDWWASFLASRGYAVLQSNFRGSGGYGRSWRTAGFRQWGGLMQTDVEDGAAALIRAGLADARRVCIVGGSYGGYAALAGATLTPDRYACAASIAGVSDLELMLTQIAARTGRRSISSDWWRLSIGDRAEDRARIRSVSPVHLAANVRAPILLLHGTEDTVVPIEQSRRMEAALRGAGRDVRFVELPGDDHWLSAAQTRTQMLRELETFLAAQIGQPRQ